MNANMELIRVAYVFPAFARSPPDALLLLLCLVSPSSPILLLKEIGINTTNAFMNEKSDPQSTKK